MNILKKSIAEFAGRLEMLRYGQCKSFCIFLGYSRSGHSLVGALLDAHPSVTIAHELNVLDLVRQDFSYPQMFYLIGRNARKFGKAGRLWEGYDYSVAGQSQGRRTGMKVVGDKKGGTSTNLLIREPELLQRLQELLPVPLKIIHVIRNPFDVVATRYQKNQKFHALDQLVDSFLLQARFILSLKENHSFSIHDVVFEELIGDPDNTLQNLLNFLGVAGDDSYFSACRDKIFPAPHKSREEICWPEPIRQKLIDACSRISFLSEYKFNS